MSHLIWLKRTNLEDKGSFQRKQKNAHFKQGMFLLILCIFKGNNNIFATF